MTFAFYDLDTTGISPAFDQPLQFAAILTDGEFREIERVNLRCRIAPHIIPSPWALAVTGVRPVQLVDPALPTFFEFTQEIGALIERWSAAIWTGFNGIRFDEEMLRQIALLYKIEKSVRSQGLAPVNHKSVYRIMKANSLLLARKYTERPENAHDGKVVVLRSNLRWCSDGFELTCWNGDIVRGAFIIDACDREVIAWRAVVNAGISGSDVRDMMLEAVERRFGTFRAPAAIEILSDNGAPYTARETRIFARQLGLKPCFTPVQSPQSNGISEAFVNTLKRDYVHVSPLPDAETVLGLIAGWIEDYNENHPHSGLKMRSPCEFIAAQTATA